MGSQNSITIVKQTSTSGVQEETFSIDSYQLVQLQTNGSILKVKSSKEVAVIMTHPCVETENCNCNMVMNQILPTKFHGRSFIVPSIFNVSETKLLMLSENTSTLFHTVVIGYRLLPQSFCHLQTCRHPSWLILLRKCPSDFTIQASLWT